METSDKYQDKTKVNSTNKVLENENLDNNLFVLEKKQYEEQIKPLQTQLEILYENPPKIDEKNK